MSRHDVRVMVKRYTATEPTDEDRCVHEASTETFGALSGLCHAQPFPEPLVTALEVLCGCMQCRGFTSLADRCKAHIEIVSGHMVQDQPVSCDASASSKKHNTSLGCGHPWSVSFEYHRDAHECAITQAKLPRTWNSAAQFKFHRSRVMICIETFRFASEHMREVEPRDRGCFQGLNHAASERDKLTLDT